MKLAATAALAGLLALAPAPPAVNLARATWTRNGVAPAAAPAVAGDPGAATVELPFDGSGVRWACEFTTSQAQMRRLQLDWRAGPDGGLFEIVLDGARLSPPRDGWRPAPRALHSDLGSVWVGAGAHLVEFVAREQPPEGGARLRLASLELGEP
jgi:hypothetical protein